MMKWSQSQRICPVAHKLTAQDQSNADCFQGFDMASKLREQVLDDHLLVVSTGLRRKVDEGGFRQE